MLHREGVIAARCHDSGRLRLTEAGVDGPGTPGEDRKFEMYEIQPTVTGRAG